MKTLHSILHVFVLLRPSSTSPHRDSRPTEQEESPDPHQGEECQGSGPFSAEHPPSPRTGTVEGAGTCGGWGVEWRGCLLTACENWATSIVFCLTYRTLEAKTTSLPVEGCGGTVTNDRSPKLSDSHSMVLSNFHNVLSLYSCQDVPLGMWPFMV